MSLEEKAQTGDGSISNRLACSFCGKDQQEVEKLVTSSRNDGEVGRVAICNECFGWVAEIMSEDDQ